MDDVTNKQRADWARIALTNYEVKAAQFGLPSAVTTWAGRGRAAAEAFATATNHRAEQRRLSCAEVADEVISDLLACLFHLTDGEAAPPALLRAVERIEHPGPQTPEQLHESLPGTSQTALFTAQLLVALRATAEDFGLDWAPLAEDARGVFGEEVEAERYNARAAERATA
ncbi:hypothetical protein ABZZ36_32425 [Actinacidiphila glaucinigra]|uniref:hypothetical protein n=1 Tax=Actinacidiphila glaucinigra TaxID=235986 RepID=UPI0033A661EA